MRRIVICLVFAAGGATVTASPAFASPETLHLTPGNMLAQTHSSAMLFTVTGTYRQLNGTLDFDPATKTCSVEVTFQTRSLALPNAIMRGQVMSKNFLDPAKYPTSRFVGTCTKDGTVLAGELTNHGQTHPFDMAVTYRMAGGHLVGIDTVGSFNRYEWGLTGKSMTVGKTIKVTNDISLDGKPPT
ncbi:MAG: YceI family protein [Acidiphilium sp.]|nr:YceI family protein [Acidiphilium sp.]MDD4934506.1 YceI family protein [Acidiphilium sp.]